MIMFVNCTIVESTTEMSNPQTSIAVLHRHQVRSRRGRSRMIPVAKLSYVTLHTRAFSMIAIPINASSSGAPEQFSLGDEM